jgi:hypothetical protein
MALITFLSATNSSSFLFIFPADAHPFDRLQIYVVNALNAENTGAYGTDRPHH